MVLRAEMEALRYRKPVVKLPRRIEEVPRRGRLRERTNLDEESKASEAPMHFSELEVRIMKKAERPMRTVEIMEKGFSGELEKGVIEGKLGRRLITACSKELTRKTCICIA